MSREFRGLLVLLPCGQGISVQERSLGRISLLGEENLQSRQLRLVPDLLKEQIVRDETELLVRLFPKVDARFPPVVLPDYDPGNPVPLAKPYDEL